MTPHIRVGVSAAIVQDSALLLVEFDDATGLHYNLPGGGIEPGEGALAALEREVREETGLAAAAGPLLCAWEYVPTATHAPRGRLAKLNLLFACTLSVPIAAQGRLPLPPHPDTGQIGVVWMPLADLPHTPLLPRPTGVLLRALQTGRGAPGFFSVE